MIGQTIGNYRVIARLGGGGMGVVYSAEDTRLGRRVAMKFLSDEMARHPQALERFEREARAASALNHPNIATVYDVGTHEGRPYLVMELVEGQPLDQKLRERRLDAGTLLDWAIQIADALDAAHAKSIVHRDVKPANLLVNMRGQVKVLDFGLAKVAEPAAAGAPDAPMSAGPTLDAVLTSPGVAVGTVSYMSPEQARGEELDARSDLFSLGCVMYEMATGQRAFPGKTPAIIFHAILERTPVPARELNPALPAKFDEIIFQALEKDRELRYQTAAEFRADLKRLKRDREIGRDTSSTVSPGPAGAATDAAPSPPPSWSRFPGGGAREPATPHPTQRSKRPWLALGLGLFAAAALAFALLIYSFSARRERETAALMPVRGAPFSSLSVKRLTTTGNVYFAALSRDGNYLAYLSFGDAGKNSLFLRQVSTGSTVELLAPQDNALPSLAFSPDGTFVYYTSLPLGHFSDIGSFFQIPSLGGAPRLIASHVQSDVALSSDGKRIAYLGRLPGEEKTALLIAGLDDSTERPHALLRGVEPSSSFTLAWSPDAQLLAMVETRPDPSGLPTRISTVRANTGAVERLGTTRWNAATGGVAWLPDGSGLLLCVEERTGKSPQVWFVSYPDGAARQITSSLQAHAGSVSISGDGRAFVTVEGDSTFNLWIAPKGEEKFARQITFGRSEGTRGFAWTADQKLIYGSNATGLRQLWLTDLQGGKPRQLTTDEKSHRSPTVCSGTDRVFYTSDASGPLQLWSVGLEDSQVRQESNGEQQFFSAECSPDGSWFAGLTRPKDVQVEFGAIARGSVALMERGGGQLRTLFDGDAFAPAISPDGKRVAFVFPAPGSPGGLRIGVVPATGGALEKSFDLPPSSVHFPLRWTPDGRSLAYLDTRTDTANVWAQPLNGGKPKQLTYFLHTVIVDFAWSRNGKLLALSRGSSSSDAVLFTSTR